MIGDLGLLILAFFLGSGYTLLTVWLYAHWWKTGQELMIEQKIAKVLARHRENAERDEIDDLLDQKKP